MAIETRTHTALHVLKGAAVKVLGTRWTAGVHVKGNHGRLTLQYDRKPTLEEVTRIEELANSKIREDAPVEVTDMERREAERLWGDAIYDQFLSPRHHPAHNPPHPRLERKRLQQTTHPHNGRDRPPHDNQDPV